MGKANLPLFARILNQFGTPYTIVHDADAPMCLREKNWIKNAMWTINKSIIEVVAERGTDLPSCGIIAHTPDFEGFYFNDKLSKDKPYNATTMLNSPDFQKSDEYKVLKNFADKALAGKHPGSYDSYDALTKLVKSWRETNTPKPSEAWEFEKHD